MIRNVTPNPTDPGGLSSTSLWNRRRTLFCLNRIGSFTAPLIKISTIPISGSTSAAVTNEYVMIASMFVMLMMAFVFCGPIFVSAALFVIAAILTILVPIETTGKMAS
ncbi:hypothetical protein EDD22DRAFT_968235 [Suillus occidentalis]|nr:hypothetical protein EDD22DRAFT_968235 [Suillus occidentalis]